MIGKWGEIADAIRKAKLWGLIALMVAAVVLLVVGIVVCYNLTKLSDAQNRTIDYMGGSRACSFPRRRREPVFVENMIISDKEREELVERELIKEVKPQFYTLTVEGIALAEERWQKKFDKIMEDPVARKMYLLSVALRAKSQGRGFRRSGKFGSGGGFSRRGMVSRRGGRR